MSDQYNFANHRRSRNPLIFILLLLFFSPTKADTIYYLGWATAGGDPNCPMPPMVAKTKEEFAALRVAENNAVTTLQCWATCRNPQKLVGAYEVLGHAWYEVESLCTGTHYTADILKIENPTENDSDCVGNPCNPATGSKKQTEIDFVWPSPSKLKFVRYYHSNSLNDKSNQLVLGPNWKHNYSQKLFVLDGPSVSTPVTLAWRPNGYVKAFKKTAGQWTAEPEVKERLEQLASGNYRLTTSDDQIEEYSSTGQLISIQYVGGVTVSLAYVSGRLDSVTDSLGHSIHFTYLPNGRIDTVKDPAGNLYKYKYDSLSRLQYVVYPDATPQTDTDNLRRQYHYENAKYGTALTGITDERGIRYATWAYNNNKQVILSTHANNVERVDINYVDEFTRILTNSRNKTTTYTLSKMNGLSVVSTIAGAGCVTCKGNDADYQYDLENQLMSKTENGVTTQYGNYDSNHNPGYMIKATGTPQQRRIDYSYDPRFHSKIATITEPSVKAADPSAQCTVGVDCKITTYSYDEFGNRILMTVSGYAPDNSGGWLPVTRTTTYQYQGPLNQLTQVDGPRTDVSDVTTLEYYPDDASAGNNRARLKRVDGPMGLVLRDNIQYGSNGRELHEEMSNGVSIDYSYYPGNERLQSATQTAGLQSRTTYWTYLPTGEVQTVTQAYGTPLATTVTFGYDDARRLTRVTDQLGNTIEYTLDTEDNRVAEKTIDAHGQLVTTLSRLFDEYNHLDQQILPSGTTDYDYNPDGTLHRVTDAKTNTTTYDYDALKRLTHVQQPGGINTDYVFDVADNLVNVTDPDSHATQYSTDDLGNVLKQVSPDSGTTTYHYDVAGDLVQQTDANSQTTTYTYDALNRVTQALYADGTQDQYTYDSGVNAVGRVSQLTSLDSNTEATATVQYDYNGFGEITQKRELVDGKTFVNQYQYNALGAVSQLTYPSGTQVAYTYNGGNIDSVSINGQVFLSNVTYEPFGGVRSWQAANGEVQQRQYDTSGRLTQITQRSFSKSFSYDANHNITAMGDGTNTSNNTNYGYDALNRLIDYTASTSRIAYIYDPNSNRTQQTLSSGGFTDTTEYSIDSTSNRLLDIINAASSTTRTILYDANGNTIDNRTHSFQYDSRNRLLTVDNGDKATYQYNALSQRVRKEVKGNPADVNGDGVINHLDITATNGSNAVAVDCNSDGNPANTDNGNGKSQGNGNAKGQDTSCIAKQIGNNPISPNTQTSNGGSGGKIVSYFVYDESGQLLAEHDDMGAPVSETVYLYSIPVAVIRQGVVYTVHTDQLDTPRAISDPQGVTVWRWEGEPFGLTSADEDADGDGVKFVYNGRFAGQYFDEETGFNYNYYRYYDPSTGRYVTSDPIGLIGGMNSYNYVSGNPLMAYDSLGLFRLPPAFRKRYPKSADRIDNMIKYLTKKKRDALKKWGSCSDQEITDAFTPGKGPLIIPSSKFKPGRGLTLNIDGIQEFRVGSGTFSNYENNIAGSDQALDSVVEHETVHYLNSNGPGSPNPQLETGDEYEKEVYGKTIDDECWICSWFK